jgi:hypothetical protein
MANRRSALLLTGLTLAVWALAPSASCQEAPGPPLPTASSLWEDITTFETFHQIRLTAEQALDWAARLEPLQAALKTLRGHDDTPAVIAVLMQIRQAALEGLPVTTEMWEQLSAAQAAAGQDVEWEQVERQANEVADAMARGLAEQQRVDLARSEPLQRALNTVVEAREVLGAPQDLWTAWVERITQDIILDTPDLPVGAEDALLEFFARLRAMSGDELDAGQEQMVGELVDIIAPLGSPEELLARTRTYLSEQVMYNIGFLACLKDYAAATAADR